MPSGSQALASPLHQHKINAPKSLKGFEPTRPSRETEGVCQGYYTDD